MLLTLTWTELRRNIQGIRPFLGTPSDDNEGTIHTLDSSLIVQWRAKYPEWEGQFWGYDPTDRDHLVPVNIVDS